MKVLVVEPLKEPYEKEIAGDLKSLQKEVGGFIQAVYPFKDNVGLICNEEGKLNGEPLNRGLRDDDGDLYDVVAGTFILVGFDEEDFCSLTKKQIEKFSSLYAVPEMWISMDGALVALPYITKE